MNVKIRHTGKAQNAYAALIPRSMQVKKAAEEPMQPQEAIRSFTAAGAKSAADESFEPPRFLSASILAETDAEGLCCRFIFILLV